MKSLVVVLAGFAKLYDEHGAGGDDGDKKPKPCHPLRGC